MSVDAADRVAAAQTGVGVPITQVEGDGLPVEDEADIPVGVIGDAKVGLQAGAEPLATDFRIERDGHVLDRLPRQRDDRVDRVVAGVRIADPWRSERHLVVEVGAAVDDRADGQPVGELVRGLGVEFAEAAEAVHRAVGIS